MEPVSMEIDAQQVTADPLPFARRQLHQTGALTDNLDPDIAVEEVDAQKFENAPYNDEHPIFFPPELVNKSEESEKTLYHRYLIELKQNFDDDIPADNIVLATRMKIESEILKASFQLEVEKGVLTVNFMYVGFIELNKEQVHRCKKFQVAIFKALMERKIDKLTEVLDGYQLGNRLGFDYLLLPSSSQRQRLINWECVSSVLFSSDNNTDEHTSNCLDDNARFVHTKNGLLCECLIRDSLVYTPHNGHVYCINGFREHLDANSYLRLSDGVVLRYKEYYETRHNIQLRFDQQTLLNGRQVFHVKNYIQSGKRKNNKESSRASVELPPELCHIIMSPVSLSTLHSFTFLPSIMHRLQSLLIALNLKRMLLDHCMQNVTIPVTKVLEAITTKKCQESFHLKSLATLGDSFLKYAASQQLFKKYQNHQEGLLSEKKESIISNAALCRLGCEHSLPGFIRMERFNPKKWIIPGDNSSCCELNEFQLSDTRKTYIGGRKMIKIKTVADVVEALIGAFLSTGGENAGLIFLNWIGIKVDFEHMKYERSFHLQAEKLFNLHDLESLLNYSFRDRSLLVEALTHGSYMLPEIPRCYQRLEFLGDAVLDYLITLHLFNNYPRLSPGLLTDMRSASVNNECYAQSAVKHGLHKYILHASEELQKQITLAASNFSQFSADSTFGWECETSYPRVLGDIIESLAGAILVDSDYNKEVVFKCIRPLLDPLITPETVKFHPAHKLNELCQKMHFSRKKVVSRNHGVSSVTVEVNANGTVFKHTSAASNKETAKKLACKEVLNSIRESILDLS